MYKIYEVQMGDTLDSIARKLGVNSDVLATLNGLNVMAPLMPQTYIVIPSTDSLFNKYTVRPGDTLNNIAEAYDVDLGQLAKLNGIKDVDYIYAGEELMVPKPGTKFYITGRGDALNMVANFFGTSAGQLLNQNPNIVLGEEQLIVYKK